jgi:hypothetical protein
VEFSVSTIAFTQQTMASATNLVNLDDASLGVTKFD